MWSKREKTADFLVACGNYCIIATCFFIPLSTTLMGLFACLVVFFWFLSGRIFSIHRLLSHSPVSCMSLVLFFLFVIGIFYSPVDYEVSLHTLAKYRELVFIPAVIGLAKGNRRYITIARDSYVAGSILLMFISFGMASSLVPIERYGNSILYHITHSYFMAFLAFVSLHHCFDSRQYRYFWIFIFITATINLIYVTPGRTGMIIYAFLMLLFIVQRFSFKKQLIAFAVIISLIVGSFYASNNVSKRMTVAWKEIASYYEEGRKFTSLGMRLEWFENSIKLIDDRPFFGHGTGSYQVVQAEKIKKQKKQITTDNPHNEFLFIGVQLGYVGLTVFILLLIVMWLRSFNISSNHRWLVQGVILSMVLGCMMNSFLFDAHQGHFFAFLSALLFSSIHAPHPTLTFR